MENLFQMKFLTMNKRNDEKKGVKRRMKTFYTKHMTCTKMHFYMYRIKNTSSYANLD
jgi:hypothetical protein